MSISIKLCKDCIYCLPSPNHEPPNHYNYARCTFNRGISLVTGDPVPMSDLPYCDQSRRTTGICGIDGLQHRENAHE